MSLESRQTTAINPKHQRTVNRFVKYNYEYDMATNNEEERKAANAYDKASRAWHELPKREQENLVKTHDYLALGNY